MYADASCHNYYPIFVSLAGRSALIAGFGAVGARKLSVLLKYGCERVYVFDPRAIESMPDERQNLLADERVAFHSRPCLEEDIKKCFLVYACANDEHENLRIANICRQLDILCNCAEGPGNGSFILPAIAACHNLVAAISTSGQSPFLAARWRVELGEWLKPRAALSWLMGKLRPLILARRGRGANREIFQKIADSPIGSFLEQHDIEGCLAWLVQELPFCSEGELRHILLEYDHVFR